MRKTPAQIANEDFDRLTWPLFEEMRKAYMAMKTENEFLKRELRDAQSMIHQQAEEKGRLRLLQQREASRAKHFEKRTRETPPDLEAFRRTNVTLRNKLSATRRDLVALQADLKAQLSGKDSEINRLRRRLQASAMENEGLRAQNESFKADPRLTTRPAAGRVVLVKSEVNRHATR